MGGNSGGGGGSSGYTDFPAYIKGNHNILMQGTKEFGDASAYVNTLEGKGIYQSYSDAWDTNPYIDAQVFNPTALFNNSQERLNVLLELIDSVDIEADHRNHLTAALVEFDEDLSDDEVIDNLIQAFVESSRTGFNQTQATFKAGMASQNAVMSSQYVFGLSRIAIERIRQIGDFTKQLRLDRYNQRVAYGTQVANLLEQLNAQKIENVKNFTLMQAEMNRIIAVGLSEYYQEEEGMDVKAATWRLDLAQMPANVLAAAAGGVVGKSKSSAGEPNKSRSMIGGALSGAGAGFSAFGPIGGAIGGLGGLGLGAIS